MSTQHTRSMGVGRWPDKHRDRRLWMDGCGWSTAAAIGDVELCLYDVQPATLGGVHSEFVYGARLDNLVNAFAATEVRTLQPTPLLSCAGSVAWPGLRRHSS
jgi:hypothetical protein